jgi:hypothetical protein
VLGSVGSVESVGSVGSVGACRGQVEAQVQIVGRYRVKVWLPLTGSPRAGCSWRRRRFRRETSVCQDERIARG